MSKKTLAQVAKDVQYAIVKHSPEILTGLGISGMLTTTVLAVKATPKALILIEEEKRRRSQELSEPVEKLDTLSVVKTTWKCYIPSAVIGVLSAGCIIGANSVNLRRNAALATAYTLSETALKEYQEKVVETIGEKKEQLIRDKVAEEKIQKNPVSSNEVIVTGRGDTLCYDVISGRYFNSDIEKIRKAENVINRRLMDEMWVTLNEFYYEIGLPGTTVGQDLGWDVDQGLIDIHFSAQMSEDERPCMVIDYSIEPKYRRY